MKKNKVIAHLFAMSMMINASVMADEKYPASDFRPEVVYQDKEYITKNSSSSVEATSTFEVDAKYPAANFEPKVIYSDSSYKHSEPSSSVAKTTEPQAVSVVEESSTAEPMTVAAQETDEKDYFNSMLIVGLLVLAVGIVLFRGKFRCGFIGKLLRRSSVSGAANSPDVRVSSQKLTGVARYLNKLSGTGVSRYIEKQVKTPAAVTGVARYVAKQATSQKGQAPQSAVTGVEKYMRNRG